MVWWFALAMNAALFVVAEFMRPKPELEDAQAVPFEEAGFPNVNPESKIPIVRGTVRITSPFCMAVPEYTPLPIRKRIKTGAFSSEKQTLGHRYFVGMSLSVCDPGATLKKIYYDEKEIWSGSAAPSATGVAIDIDLPEFLGGETKGGGIVGRFRWWGGGLTQTTSDYLAQFQDPLPAYRNRSRIDLESVEVGETPNVSAFAFEVEHISNPLGLTLGRERIDGNEVGTEANPMSVLYEIFNNNDWGYGLPAADIDTTELITAANELHDEGNGMSWKWVNAASMTSIISTMMRQVAGFPRYNTSTGKWGLRLARDDYDPGLLLQIDNSNSTVTDFARADWSETANRIALNYTQREFTENPSPAQASDGSNFSRVGTHRIHTVNMPNVYSTALANDLASRELINSTHPLSKVELTVNRQAYNLLPGDVFVLTRPERGIIQVVYRVTQISFGTPDQTEISINAMEDIFGLELAVLKVPQPIASVPLSESPQEIVDISVTDRPYFLGLFDDDATGPDANKPIVVAARPQNNSLEYLISLREGSDEYVAEAVADYTALGALQSALSVDSADPASVVVKGISSAEASALSADAVAVSADDIQLRGEHFCLIVTASQESEWIAYETLVDNLDGTVTLNNVRRGLIDTPPLDHAVDDEVWFISAANGTSQTEYGDTATVNVKAQNTATTGTTALAAATQQALTFRDRPDLPYPAGFFKVNAQFYPSDALPAGNITLTWAGRNRLNDRIRFQTDSVNETLESGHEFQIKIFDGIGDTLLRTVNQTGTTYVYTQAFQAADGGPFSNYRVELRTQNATGGTPSNLIDQIRVFNLTLPAPSVPAGYQGFIEDEEPVAYWPMNDVDAGTAIDEVIGSISTTLVGSTAKHGRPLSPDNQETSVFSAGFDGAYISAADNAALDFADTWSFECLGAFSTEDDGQYSPIVMRNSPTPKFQLYRKSAATINSLILEIRDEAGDTPVTGLTIDAGIINLFDGEIHHIIVTQDVGGGDAPAKVYVDGFFVDQSASVGKPFAQATPMTFMGDSFATRGNTRGYLGHVAIYDKVLDADDVLTHYQRSRRVDPVYTTIMRTVPTSWWRLQEHEDTGAGAIKDWIQETGNDLTPINTPGMRQGSPLAAPQRGNSIRTIATSTEALDLPGAIGRTASGSWGCWVKIPTGETADNFFVMGVAAANVNDGMWLGYEGHVTGEFRFSHSVQIGGGGNPTSSKATSRRFPTDTWHHVMVTGDGTTEWKIYINGRLEPLVDGTLDVGGGANHTNWLADTASSCDNFSIGSRNSDSGRTNLTDAFVSDVLWYETTALTGDQVREIYLASVVAFRSYTDIMLDDEPEHVFELADTGTAVADLRDNMNGVTGAWQGTPVEDQAPIVNDDVVRPVRFSDPGTDQGIKFSAYAFLEAAKGTGNFWDYGLSMVTAYLNKSGGAIAHMMLNQGSSGHTNFDISVEPIAGTNRQALDYDKWTPSNGQLRSADATYPPGFSGHIAFKEKSTRRDFFIEGQIPAYDTSGTLGTPTSPETFTGNAMNDGYIAHGQSSNRVFEGQISHIAIYSRYVEEQVLRRQHHRAQGHHEHPLAILQHNPTLYWRFNEGSGALEVVDHSGNENGGTVETVGTGGAAEFGESTNRSNVWHENQGALRAVAVDLTNGALIQTDTVPLDPSVYPYSIGFWGRPETTADASDQIRISLGDKDTDSRLSVGVNGDTDNFEVIVENAGTLDSATLATGVTVEAEWHHYVFAFNAGNDIDCYADGEFVGTVTTVDAVTFAADNFTAMGEVFNQTTPVNVFNGKVHDLFTLDSKALIAAEVREIYIRTFRPTYDQAVAALGAVAYWRLNDYLVSGKWRNGVADAAGVTTFADGGAMTGITQAAAGIIPNYPDSCLETSGSNVLVDTGYTDIAGTAARSFSFWVKRDAGASNSIWSQGIFADGQWMTAHSSGGDIRFSIHGATIVFSGGSLGTGIHHLVFTMPAAGTSDDIECYLDGVKLTNPTSAAKAYNTSTTNGINFGGDVGATFADWDGRLSGFAVFDYEMTAEDAELLYEAGA